MLFNNVLIFGELGEYFDSTIIKRNRVNLLSLHCNKFIK